MIRLLIPAWVDLYGNKGSCPGGRMSLAWLQPVGPPHKSKWLLAGEQHPSYFPARGEIGGRLPGGIASSAPALRAPSLDDRHTTTGNVDVDVDGQGTQR